MPKIYWEIEQGSVAWFTLRMGIPTASEFHHIITPKQGKIAEARHKYACRLIAEAILRWQAESLETLTHIQEAKENEPRAVKQMEFTAGIETQAVGFVTTTDGRFGASPDRAAAVAADRSRFGTTVEVKCPTVPKMMEYLLLEPPDPYRSQVQGQLLVTEADKAIFYAYHPRMPPHLLETGRDEPFLAAMRGCLEQFSDELAGYMRKAKSLGVYQAFPQVVTPLEELTDPALGPHHEDPNFVEKWLQRYAGRMEG